MLETDRGRESPSTERWSKLSTELIPDCELNDGESSKTSEGKLKERKEGEKGTSEQHIGVADSTVELEDKQQGDERTEVKGPEEDCSDTSPVSRGEQVREGKTERS